ncbi:MAG: DUF4234 domain-containing protein [Solirubrobacterales bacterium]|nr:DUF4234 domain-containing protein [Solirubrobacterales bacterium]
MAIVEPGAGPQVAHPPVITTDGRLAAPAEEFALDSFEARGRVRSFGVGLLLSFLTLGIYPMVWYYKLNAELQHVGIGRGDPQLSASRPAKSLAAWIFGAALLGIPNVLSLHGFTQRIARAEAVAGIPHQQRLNATGAFLLMFPFGFLIVTQLVFYYRITEHQNRILRAAGAPRLTG